jgi:cytochrome c oxidase assembly protein subunit 15
VLLHWSGNSQAILVPMKIKFLLVACMFMLLTQIILGTEVRGAIDRVAETIGRELWISRIWSDFVVHRSFSWAVLLVHAIFILKLRKSTGNNPLSLTLVLLILLTILSGAGMGYFSMPAFLQPIHLLVATVTFGIQWLLFLRLNTNKEVVLSN